MQTRTEVWPALPLATWKDTRDTLHRWTQVVGKVRLALAPRVNHWWQVPLYVGARGLTTSAIPYGDGAFEITFDFIDHVLDIEKSDGATREIELGPRSVADFHREVMATLGELGIDVGIWTMPVEIENPIRFEEDYLHASYDLDAAHTFWQILLEVDKVLEEFRAPFLGKCSPVHFFWGSFDLAVSRFSGRLAPQREGADSITREAYSHEVISAGFWTGGGAIPDAAFYSYTYPEPPGLQAASVRPPRAFYSRELSEFILMYEDARAAESPAAAIREFLESTYEAGATLANWNRAELERTGPSR